jgi:hypothetical protein
MQGDMCADGGERAACQQVTKRHNPVADEGINYLRSTIFNVA